MNTRFLWLKAYFLVVCLFIGYSPLRAQWSNDPVINNPICTASYVQKQPAIASDGNQGAYLFWEDGRNGNRDIYGQHINHSGYLSWVPNGISICSTSTDQIFVKAVPDGSGGAIVAWYEEVNNGQSLYVQKVSPTGSVLWGTGGVQVCGSGYVAGGYDIVSDMSGGVLVAWADARNITPSNSYLDIYAQRVNSSGQVNWTANGIAVDTTGDIWFYPRMIMDSQGSALVAWNASPAGQGRTTSNIYAQRISLNGSLLWSAGRKAICAYSSQKSEQIDLVATGGNGALVVWNDWRASWDVFMQRITSSGDLLWNSDGVPICDDSTSTVKSVGNMVPAWDGDGAVLLHSDTLVRVNLTGSILWKTGGVMPFGGAKLVSCGMYGTIVTWEQQNMPSLTDIYAQKYDTAGIKQWGQNGVQITAAYEDQYEHAVLGNTTGSAIVAWTDWRNSFNTDIYAQAIFQDGSLPVELEYFSAKIENSSVYLSWSVTSEINTFVYEIQRKVVNGDWEIAGAVHATGESDRNVQYRYIDKDFEKLNSDIVSYRLKIVDADGECVYSAILRLSTRDDCALKGVDIYPNPASDDATVKILASRGVTTLIEIVDILGRVAVRRIATGETNRWEYEHLDLSALPSGQYMLRVRTDDVISINRIQVQR